MLYTIKNDFLTVAVAGQGAELMSIKGSDGTEYLWQGDPKYWSDRALNIFPYVARLTDGSYYMDGDLHQMNIHGIAPYRCFAVAEHTEDKLVLELVSDDETYASYPRNFAFRICYALRENNLDVTFEVENKDDKTMYFGLGGHPGFNVPLAAGKSFEDYRLRFEEPCEPVRVGFTENCFLNGQDEPFALEGDTVLALHHDMFDDDAIVLRNMGRKVTLETEGDAHSVTVTFPQMDYLGLWHWPKTDAPYICIEPWSSLPSTQDQIAVFEEQKDLISLAAGETYRNLWTIEVK